MRPELEEELEEMDCTPMIRQKGLGAPDWPGRLQQDCPVSAVDSTPGFIRGYIKGLE